MKPLQRNPVRKGKSAAHFRHNTKRTATPNLNKPMRGGWRF